MSDQTPPVLILIDRVEDLLKNFDFDNNKDGGLISRRSIRAADELRQALAVAVADLKAKGGDHA